MHERSSKPEPDASCTPLGDRAAEDSETHARPANPKKNPAAVELGRLGGKKGGKARAEKLTPERRREIAKKAAAARWNKGEG
jgi:hypothetical protein